MGEPGGLAVRDHRRLDVFRLAHRVALEVYSETCSFPNNERYGLTSQLRRGAVSTAANIVEEVLELSFGSADKETEGD